MCSTRRGGMLHCSKPQTRITKNLPKKIRSRKKCGRTSMCFEFDVHTGFCARFFAPSLSSKTALYVVPNPGIIKSTHTARTYHLNGLCQIKTALSNTAGPTQTDMTINSQNQIYQYSLVVILYHSSLFLTSTRNMGAIHTSGKHGVSPRSDNA